MAVAVSDGVASCRRRGVSTESRDEETGGVRTVMNVLHCNIFFRSVPPHFNRGYGKICNTAH